MLRTLVIMSLATASLAIVRSDSSSSTTLEAASEEDVQQQEYKPTYQCLFPAPKNDCRKATRKWAPTSQSSGQDENGEPCSFAKKNCKYADPGGGGDCEEYYHKNRGMFGQRYQRCRDAGNGLCDMYGKSHMIWKNCPAGKPPHGWWLPHQCEVRSLCECLKEDMRSCTSKYSTYRYNQFPRNQRACVDKEMKKLVEVGGEACVSYAASLRP